jgi:hypothetical protein
MPLGDLLRDNAEERGVPVSIYIDALLAQSVGHPELGHKLPCSKEERQGQLDLKTG